MSEPAICDHCSAAIPGYYANGWAWWCRRCIREHAEILREFTGYSSGCAINGLHWGSDASSAKIRSIPKYDNVVI